MADKKHFSVTDFPHLMVDNNVTPHPLEDYIISHPMEIPPEVLRGEVSIEVSVAEDSSADDTEDETLIRLQTRIVDKKQ
ncbi:MAG: hypothetical protein K6E75_09660 [Lachnospiraceae bacterium]|nr:hypothetical protein [Lachnospiraceae bacterium]